MKVPLPNLDDRRWADLVDEGRSLIPAFAPGWTDHNIHDPGITVMELLASVAEMDVYWLNRISDEHRRKFLSLIGVNAWPPRPARTVLSFKIDDSAAGLPLPASLEFEGRDDFGHDLRFRTLADVHIAPGELRAVQLKDAAGFRNLTESWRRQESFLAFGEAPAPGSELYLGFSQPFPLDAPVSLYFKFAGLQSDAAERMRLLVETNARTQACRAPHFDLTCDGKTKFGLKEPVETPADDHQPLPPHHGARTTWEVFTEDGQWRGLQAGVTDDTRTMTLDGSVVMRVSEPMAPKAIGKVEEKLYYLCCRFVAGAFDAPPVIETVIFNAIVAEQSVPAGMKFVIAQKATVVGTAPQPGEQTRLRLQFDAQGRIHHLEFDAETNAPKFTLLEYTAATAVATGSLTLEALFVGVGEGKPFQELALREAPVMESSFRLFTLEDDGWREWNLRRDFDASRRDDAHFLLDATSGEIRFGDGEKGRVAPVGCLIFAKCNVTAAEDGNLAARTITRLADSAHNHALYANFDQLKKRFDCQHIPPTDCISVSNSIAAGSGRAAETLNKAAARAIELMNESWRAVTLADYETLALKTPGVRLARVKAWAGLHAEFPCLKAPGIITVVVLPAMPVARPQPSAGLRRVVAAYLQQRRLIGTRVLVVGPDYREVTVRATVKSFDAVGKAALERRIKEALDIFFSPFDGGGPEGAGWPFGRDVYRSEVLQVLDEVAGVDHVVSLELIADNCDPQCGNICLAPTQLVAAGKHAIEVI